MVADVHFEFLAQPTAFPIRKKIPVIVEIRAAPEVDVAHQHPAKMADMAHAIARRTNRAEKFYGAHHDHKNPHGHRYRQWKNPHLTVRHDDGHREQNAVNGAGSSNCGNQCRAAAMRVDDQLYDNVNKACADSAHKKINIELARSPTVFEVRAEHRQVQQVEKNVKDAAVKKNISKRLPDAKAVDGSVGTQSEPINPKSLPRFVKEQPGNCLQEKN